MQPAARRYAPSNGIAGKVNALVFSPDGETLFAAAGDAGVNGIAYEWRTGTGELVRKYEGHTDALYALALSPDGQQLATGSYDQKIKLWKVADGSEVRMLKGHTGAVFGLSFRPDGKVLASASADRTVKLWEVVDRQAPGYFFAAAQGADDGRLRAGWKDRRRGRRG